MKTKTTKSQHTPAPWTFDDVWHLIKGPNGEEVAAIHSAAVDGKLATRATAAANARLITAAPELAAAGRALVAALAKGDPQYSLNAEEGSALNTLAAILEKI